MLAVLIFFHLMQNMSLPNYLSHGRDKLNASFPCNYNSLMFIGLQLFSTLFDNGVILV